MDTTNTGTPGAAEQTQTGTQQPAEQSTQQTAQAAQQSTQQAAETTTTTPAIPPEVQAQIDAAQKRVTELEQSARYHQSRADQALNQVRALAGVQQPQDPIAPFLKPYTDLGIDEKDARVLAQRDYQTEQRFASLQGSIQAQSQIPTVLRQVYEQNPQLWQYPEVVSAMENSLREAAANGQAQYVHPEYAFNIGAIEYVKALNKAQGSQQQPPPQRMQIPSQFGPVGSFTPQQPQTAQQPQIPPHIQAAIQAEKAMLAQRYNFQPQKQ
jgi:hypothetical protein